MRTNIIGNYIITRDGKVINKETKRILKIETTRNGYNRVTLSMDGNTKRFLLHRLVASMYIPNPHDKPQINHKNGIKTDNNVENLEWVSQSENMKHSYNELNVGLYDLNNSNKIPVIMFEDDEATRFNSLAECARFILKKRNKTINRRNVKNTVSRIIAVCKGKRKTTFNKKFKYDMATLCQDAKA